MNYLAHAMPFLDQPYFAAGTSVPDWLTVVDRRVRLRSKDLRAFLEDSDPSTAALVGGILQHLRDDLRFHGTRAFSEMSLRLTAMARDALGGESGMRPSFLGHLLVELLLDASLAAAQPAQLEAYYRTLELVDPQRIQRIVCRLAGRPAGPLAMFILEFRRRRILSDYLEDGTLAKRLNQVMCRAELAALPESFSALFPQARQWVDARRDELLEGIPSSPPSELLDTCPVPE